MAIGTTRSTLTSNFFLGLSNLFLRLEVGSPLKVARPVLTTPFQVLQDGLELHPGVRRLLSRHLGPKWPKLVPFCKNG